MAAVEVNVPNLVNDSNTFITAELVAFTGINVHFAIVPALRILYIDNNDIAALLWFCGLEEGILHVT